jgi:hypothetical protein
MKENSGRKIPDDNGELESNQDSRVGRTSAHFSRAQVWGGVDLMAGRKGVVCARQHRRHNLEEDPKDAP